MSFADNLKRELLFNDIQIKEFAGKVNVPYSTLLSYVSKDKRLPKVDIAVKIAQELGVTVEYLVTGKDKTSFEINILKNDISNLPKDAQKIILELIRFINYNIK